MLRNSVLIPVAPDAFSQLKRIPQSQSGCSNSGNLIVRTQLSNQSNAYLNAADQRALIK